MTGIPPKKTKKKEGRLSDSFRSESSSPGRAISYSWRAIFRRCIMQGRKTAKGSKDRIEYRSHHHHTQRNSKCAGEEEGGGILCTAEEPKVVWLGREDTTLLPWWEEKAGLYTRGCVDSCTTRRLGVWNS